MAKFETLQDDFDSSTLDTSKWIVVNDVTWDAGRQKLTTLAGSASAHYAKLVSANAYDLTDSYVHTKITPPDTFDAGQELLWEIVSTTAGTLDHDNKVMAFMNSATSLYFRRRIAAVNTDSPAITYSATDHAYWRVSESAGTIYFWTSPDAHTWTQQWSIAKDTLPITNMSFHLAHGTFQSVATAKVAFADNVNRPIAVPVALSGSGTMAINMAPPQVTATAVSDTQIDLTWAEQAGADRYDIERDGVVIVTDHPQANYSDTGLAGSTTYAYRVRSVRS